ncbi:squalene monooxygenase [Micromonospora sp. NPDC023633]|uniref:NAD(P)/FAD-dependent oxidoreductase n=1 Tax=Micromonospora sp. NPDC023633 TaxID=3154320 RepID=UPI0033E61CE8
MGGLLAARVLSDEYDRVLLLDRDHADVDGYRSGVPQAKHLHGLLARGREILEELFPGLSQDLIDDGATVADLQNDIRWTIDGRRLVRHHCGLSGLSMSRLLLERKVRARVLALPGVTLLPCHEVTGLTTGADAGRVTGVHAVRLADGNAPVDLSAELVVDASGRGSRAPTWLTDLGYDAPVENRVPIGITYATQHFRREPGHLAGSKGAVVTMSLENPRGGALAREEDDRWVVTLAGLADDPAPLDPEGFRAFAASLPDPAIAEVIAAATPIDDALRARFPASVRRRYERLTRLPEGFLVLGDAVCSFNPVYSQGMTVAGEEALILRACLRQGTTGIGRRFFKATARILTVPWSMATSGDERFTDPAKSRTLAGRLTGFYLNAVGAAVGRDPAVGRALLRVANLLDPPQRMVAPDMVWRVLRSARHRPAVTEVG